MIISIHLLIKVNFFLKNIDEFLFKTFSYFIILIKKKKFNDKNMINLKL